MNGCMLCPGLVSRRSTGSDTGERALLLIEHGDLHATLRKVVSAGQAVMARADDNRVVQVAPVN